ncbi:LysE family translocator [Pseudomonas sp. RIT-PI-AD]|uniref:LysE family translocator n=1 Tax=Pseudomonas sp. RIT-PI-AD TaxID=3035294 RepID=UPI0021D8A999|nr:LysE family translocator [Pseudomonas sp. RIT-PI-AD]
MTPYLSMAAFALASSITPGPVNLVALNTGARFGFLASLRHVSGATLGFTLLLLLIGLGLYELLARAPALMWAIQWGGVAFLLYMAYRLARDDGRLGADRAIARPSFWTGALMQWLNPKAWLASVAGMGLYAADGEVTRVWTFAALYFVICYLSLACWGWTGSALRRHMGNAGRVRLLNRLMAALLVASAVYLLES